MQIDINSTVLDDEIILLNSMNTQLNDLSVAMGNVNFDGVELTTAALFNEAKNTVANIINGSADDISMAELQNRIKKVRNILAESDSNLTTLFMEQNGEIANNDNLADEVFLAAYLSSNYDSFRVLENGGYYIKDENGDEYYFPSDYDPNDVHLVGYYPGLGGEFRNPAELRNQLENDGVPANTVVAISGSSRDDWLDANNRNLFDKFDMMASDLDIKVTSVQTISFSYSGDLAFRRMNDYLEKHPEIVDCSVVCVDGYCLENIYNSTYPCNMLIERNVPIYMICSSVPEYFDRVDNISSDLSEMGYNIYVLTENNIGYNGQNCHDGANDNLFRDRLYEYLSGQRDTIENSSNYTVYKYEDGNSFLVDDFFVNKDAPEQPTTVPEEPTNTPEQPTTVPEEPANTPEQPTTVPEEPTNTPEQPTTVPEEPTNTPEQPTTVPEEPTNTPEQPTTVPENPITIPKQSTPSTSQSSTPSRYYSSAGQSTTTSSSASSPTQSPISSVPSSTVPEESTSNSESPAVPQQQPVNVPEESTKEPDLSIEVLDEAETVPESSPEVEEELITVPEESTSSDNVLNENNQNLSSNDVNVDNSSNAKKFIIPGIIGAGIAAAGVAAGNIMKNKKKNDDI